MALDHYAAGAAHARETHAAHAAWARGHGGQAGCGNTGKVRPQRLRDAALSPVLRATGAFERQILMTYG
jgi:hypothetical protein